MGAALLALGCSDSDGDGIPDGGTSSGGTTTTSGSQNGSDAGDGDAGEEDAGKEDAGEDHGSVSVDDRVYPYYASCDYRGSVAGTSSLAGRCRDWYSGPNPPSLASSCNETYMREPCPDGERVGQCQLDPVIGVVAVYNYYAPTWTAESAREACGGKTWIAVADPDLGG